MKKNQKGFSLIELLIVVCVIGIIAAIAIPNLIASRRAANEGSAVSTVRTIHNAEATYIMAEGKGSYGSLESLGSANYLDKTIGSAAGSKSGYNFNVEMVNPPDVTIASLAIGAVPKVSTGIIATGSRRFCAATDGSIITYMEGDIAISPAQAGSASAPAGCETE